jgi:hypothetical protein
MFSSGGGVAGSSFAFQAVLDWKWLTATGL